MGVAGRHETAFPGLPGGSLGILSGACAHRGSIAMRRVHTVMCLEQSCVILSPEFPNDHPTVGSPADTMRSGSYVLQESSRTDVQEDGFLRHPSPDCGRSYGGLGHHLSCYHRCDRPYSKTRRSCALREGPPLITSELLERTLLSKKDILGGESEPSERCSVFSVIPKTLMPISRATGTHAGITGPPR